jgi:hypothetical protein
MERGGLTDITDDFLSNDMLAAGDDFGNDEARMAPISRRLVSLFQTNTCIFI